MSNTSQHADDKSSVPTYIGRYRIDGLYSKGGMSTIYLATDPATNDQIIIKVLLPRFLSDPGIVQRFVNEGRIIAMTDHPNIVKLYEYGEWEGGVFIAMEFVRGMSLRRILQRNPLSLKASLEVLLQVCYAIAHLHSHGVIHGDLKPENILITDQNQVKVIDFGIAKVLADHPEGMDGKPKHFVGTPVYMGPEVQSNPRACSIQSDIYSIGIIAYELVMGKITHGRVILTLAPRGMQAILQQALQPKPEDRYHDLNELITDISEYIRSGNLQKDRQGIDYFFELYAQLETQQKSLLTSLLPQNGPHIGVTASYGVGINALYFRSFQREGCTVYVLAKGTNNGLCGIIDTYRLHTLFEAFCSTPSTQPAEESIPSIFEEAVEQRIAFAYSLLVIYPSTLQYIWKDGGWGLLFLSSGEETHHITPHESGQHSIQGSYTHLDRLTIVGCTSPMFLEFSPAPAIPLDLTLIEAINSTNRLSCEKQTNIILQKLRLVGECVVDEHPVFILSTIL